MNIQHKHVYRQQQTLDGEAVPLKEVGYVAVNAGWKKHCANHGTKSLGWRASNHALFGGKKKKL